MAVLEWKGLKDAIEFHSDFALLSLAQWRGVPLGTNRVVFQGNFSDPFSSEIQERVNQYVKDSPSSGKCDYRMIAKSIFFLGGFFVCYALTLTHAASSAWLALWLLMGVFSAGIGFNVGHDALHGAYSSSRSLNRILGHSFTMIGAHADNWRTLHNVIHHSYTNIAGADGDLHPGAWFRFFQSTAPAKAMHRFQHLYAIPLYALTSLVWVFKKDFDHIHKTEHYIYKKPKAKKHAYKLLVATKAAYLFAFLVLPVWLGGYTVGQVILGFVAMHAIQGLFLAMVFQLGHLVEGPEIHLLEEHEAPFAAQLQHQLRSTANFAPRNLLVRFFTGGLNYQIEHHLFPQMCHVHYPAVSLIVKDAAQKHGLPYFEYPTMRAALRSHFRYLRAAGKSLPMASLTPTELSSRLASVGDGFVFDHDTGVGEKTL